MNRIERKVEKVDGIVRRDKWRIEDEDIISSSQCQVHSLESGNIQPEAYAEAKSMDWRGNKPEQGGIELAEYTINQQRDDILMDIYRRRPDVACFSCYIWNLDYVEELVEELGKISRICHLAWRAGGVLRFRGRAAAAS